MKNCAYAFALTALMAATARPADYKPFAIDWNQNPETPVNMSRLLDAPAGKHGFVHAGDGHLVFENGGRFRIWGINVSSRACFPSKEDAPMVAEHLARFGINCVRFHHMDNPGTGFLDGEEGTSRVLNAELLDRLDFFAAELKQRGIYVNLNLNVARRFKEGDGVREADLLGYAKGATYYDARLIELQKEYARQLLTHRNPYTGMEYREDPAVATVEIVNENSLAESWFSGRLRGENTKPFPGTWSDIPPSYGAALDGRYNEWLAFQLDGDAMAALRAEAGAPEGGPVPRLRPEEFAGASDLRFHTEARFYLSIERAYFEDMKAFLKDELGVRAPIVGSSDHNHYRSGYPHLTALSLLDVIDGHVYWQHPNYKRDPETGRTVGYTIENTPMVNDPLFSTVVQLSRSPMAGMPYTVSETNHPFPNEFACEGIPILAAYAAFHDWDGIYFYTFEHSAPDRWEARIPGHFDIRPDPVKMAGLAVSGLMFHRGDVRPAEKTVARSYSSETVIESLRLPFSKRPFFTPGFSDAIPLLHSTRIGSLDGETSRFEKAEPADVMVSDTGELRWDVESPGQGVVTVDTPRCQAIVGHAGSREVRTSRLRADVDQAFCALQWISLDGGDLAESERMLLLAAASAGNTGAVWNRERTSLEETGSAPTVIEVVAGTVGLGGLGDGSLTVTPLDGAGVPRAEPRPAARDGSEWVVELGGADTVWYLLERKP